MIKLKPSRKGLQWDGLQPVPSPGQAEARPTLASFDLECRA